MQVKGKDGETREVAVNKRSDFYSLGLAFDESVEITPESGKNNCIFCFVRQLPRIYERLFTSVTTIPASPLSAACYITCTNLSEGDLERK
jgi:NifB/MoaA-like Fe-S oxidoreductase